MVASSVKAESVSNQLSQSIIWSPERSAKVVAFRKSFETELDQATLAQAKLYLFADTRYLLYINGNYVARGPARFDPRAPEYDTLSIGSALHPGKNVLAILVYGKFNGGSDSIKHASGLALKLDFGLAAPAMTTDTTWKTSSNTRFKNPALSADGFREEVRADLEKADWLAPDFEDQDWEPAELQNSKAWGIFIPRISPPLAEREVPYEVENGKLPLNARAKQTVVLQLKKNISGFCKLRFSAEAGSQFTVFGHHYTARAGEQEYVSANSFGSGGHQILMMEKPDDPEDDPDDVSIKIKVKSGHFVFHEIHVYESVADLTAVGEFHSSDELFNRFFQVILNSHRQITQDTYQDGLSEKDDWMGDAYVISYFTKVAFAGKNGDGTLNFADRRIFAKTLHDIALSQSKEGEVRAHHPSNDPEDPENLNLYIEDYAAYWVMGIRNYDEMTGDLRLAKELWPAVKKQMGWFASKMIAQDHLVSARDWGVFDNPYAYHYGAGCLFHFCSSAEV